MYTLLPKDSEIVAVLPHYGESGQHQTLIHVKSGDILTLPRKTITIIRYLAMRRSLDLCCLRTKVVNLTKSSQCQPLPLSPSLLLVPLRYRKPRVIRDGSLGYFNFHEIEDILPNGAKSRLVCKNGCVLPVLWQRPAIELHLQRAHLAGLACRQETYNMKAAQMLFQACQQISEGWYDSGR